MDKELINLVRLLRRKATLEYKKVKNDTSHYEGMCKGMFLGYEEAAKRLNDIINKYKCNTDHTPSTPDKEW